jgi:spore coat protein U-like protein
MKTRIIKNLFAGASTIALAIISIIITSASQAQAGSASASTQTTATLASSCQISAQNVNFGQLNLQTASGGVSASSNMTVFCTKGSAYTISLAYGGMYGQGSAGNGDYWVYQGCFLTCSAGHSNVYYEYNSSGTGLGDYVGTTAPAGTTYSNGKYYVGGVPYAYGVLTGVVSGDTIGYYISVPGQPSEVWNAGEYNYTATGNGATQNISINAKAQTGTHGPAYPTPDTYMDTVTATISY